MGAVQCHGNVFETQLKAAFPNSANKSRSPTSKMDIEAKLDPTPHKMATSIKTTSSKIVCLGDAVRNFTINHPFRLLVLQYQQVGNSKIPAKLFEYLITKAEWSTIKGGIPLSTVSSFHQHLKTFKLGDHIAGRAWAKGEKKRIKALKYIASIQLNPKIGSNDNQRRLQCSISIPELNAAVKNVNIFTPDPVDGSLSYIVNGIRYYISKVDSSQRSFS